MDSSQYSQLPSSELLDRLSARIASQVLKLVEGDDYPHPPHPMDYVSFRTFNSFITSVISRSKAKTSVVLVTLLYLDRCGKSFDPNAFGQLWLKERLFVVAIVLAHKYLEDRYRSAAQWAKLTGILSGEEIGVTERRFLQMMDWDLSVSVDYFVDDNPPS